MAFPDPISINPGTGVVSLARVRTGPSSATYESVDGLVRLNVSHERGPRKTRRSLFQLELAKVAPDPFKPTEFRTFTARAHTVLTFTPGEFTASELTALFSGETASLSAGTNANLLRLIGGES